MVHLGGNDLGQLKGFELSLKIHEDLQQLKELWPDLRVVWSDILPCQVWRGARDAQALDRVRRKVNVAVSRFVLSLGGVAVWHPLLVLRSSHFFCKDGAPLSHWGMKVLLEGIFSSLL